MAKVFKILSIGHSYVVGLNRSILRELAEDPNFEVTIVCPSQFRGSLRTIEAEPEPEHSKVKLVKVDAHLTNKMHIFAYDHFQLNKVFKEKFDFAHFWEEPYIFAGYQLGRMARKHKVPYLFRTAQSLIKKYPFPFSYFDRSTYKGASAWVAGGQLVHEAMLSKGWDKPSQVLSLGVDTAHFQPFNDVAKKEGREKLQLSAPVLGYLGRFTEAKGMDLLMDVLMELKGKSWSMLFMGSGPYEEQIKAWIKKHQLEDRVKILLLNHGEVPQILPICDLLVCPSQTRKNWKEQFGRMIVEAFAAGVPVMGSDSGEIPRVIGKAGVVLPEAHAGAWCEALESFLSNPQAFNHYRDKGIERAKNFSSKNIANSYKEFYSRLIADQP